MLMKALKLIWEGPCSETPFLRRRYRDEERTLNLTTQTKASEIESQGQDRSLVVTVNLSENQQRLEEVTIHSQEIVKLRFYTFTLFLHIQGNEVLRRRVWMWRNSLNADLRCIMFKRTSTPWPWPLTFVHPHVISSSVNLREHICQVWRNLLQMLLKYCVHKAKANFRSRCPWPLTFSHQIWGFHIVVEISSRVFWDIVNDITFRRMGHLDGQCRGGPTWDWTWVTGVKRGRSALPPSPHNSAHVSWNPFVLAQTSLSHSHARSMLFKKRKNLKTWLFHAVSSDLPAPRNPEIKLAGVWNEESKVTRSSYVAVHQLNLSVILSIPGQSEKRASVLLCVVKEDVFLLRC